MAEKYTLYLDESGDFDKDLETGWKNECLVGGILINGKNPLKEEQAKQLLISAWKKTVPSDKALSPEQIFRRAKHATELKKSEKTTMISLILEEAEKYGEFIIFENFNKTRIVNSTLTYVNIMTDGIMQLLGRLVSEHPETNVSLEVVAGFRKDTTKPISTSRLDGYIDGSECLGRIKEHLELARVKNHAIYTSKAKVSFRYDDDKANSCLILCDYICNFYLTQTAHIYQAPFKEVTLREYLLRKYQAKNIFSLYGNEERERAISYCNAQNYDGALYDICVGIINKKDTVDMVMSAFLRISAKARHNYLRALSVYFNNLIGEQRNLDLGKRVLEQAALLSKRMESAGAGDTLFALDIVLYQLTVFNHLGKIKAMEELFGVCRELLKQALCHAENLSYAFIYYNRYAVYLIDTFRVQEALDLLEQVKKSIVAYEIIFEELPDLSLSGDNIQSDQFGRILGTQVQCLRYLMAQKSCTYNQAVQFSNQAIENLNFPADKRRQYQYRSGIEAEQGNYEEALDYLCKGFHVTKWENFFDTVLSGDDFALYHLSYFTRCFAEKADEYPEIKKIIMQFRNNEKKLLKSDAYPAFLTCANVAYAMNLLDFNLETVKRYYKKSIAFSENENSSVLFHMLKLMLQAEYIAVLKEQADPEAENAIVQMKTSYKWLKDQDVPESFHNLFEHMEIMWKENSSAAFLAFANLRQY